MNYLKASKMIVLYLSLSTSAFAACDQERAEREHFKQAFDTAAATAAASCAAGSFFSIVTLGGSLIPCAAAGLTADNQRRIFEEKEANLRNCENEYLRQQQIQAQHEADRRARIAVIQQSFNVKREQISREFDAKARQLQMEFETSGFDLSNPDVQAELKEKQQALQTELNRALDANEGERNRALAGV